MNGHCRIRSVSRMPHRHRRGIGIQVESVGQLGCLSVMYRGDVASRIFAVLMLSPAFAAVNVQSEKLPKSGSLRCCETVPILRVASGSKSLLRPPLHAESNGTM